MNTHEAVNPKFYRRPDISPSLRMAIATQVLCLREYGLISRLSNEHQVSRQFIYNLSRQLCNWTILIFGVSGQDLFSCSSHQENEKLILMSQILALRLEGHCPISGIHLLLKRGNYKHTSVGYISELLNEVGAALSNTIDVDLDVGTNLQLVFAADEVFSKSQPILVTLDPVSSAILRIELVEKRDGQNWEQHWQALLDKGIRPLYITNDDGCAMAKAHASLFKDTPRQADTFHAIAHRLGDYVRQLRKKAYKAIEQEYERKRILDNRVSITAIEQALIKYKAAQQAAHLAIQQYEDFTFLYQCMIESLALFDEQGNINTALNAEQNILTAIAWIRELDLANGKINKQLDHIQKILPTLLHYFNILQQKLQKWEAKVETDSQKQALKSLCAAYQFLKNSRKVKSNKAKRYWLHLARDKQKMAEQLLANTNIDQQQYWLALLKDLEQVVQSSAMVETINSIIRSYLNVAKNQLGQNQLNLIMFYHNHRRYLKGKRKGYTPMELLTGKKQEKEWLAIMIQKAKES